MRHAGSSLLQLGAFLVTLAVAACSDALGTGPPSADRSLSAGCSHATVRPDSAPPDTEPPPPPPDTAGRAIIRGLVIGIDSTVTPPQVAPMARAAVTFFAIVPPPVDSSASTQAPPRLDSIAVVVSDRAGRFLFGGLRPHVYALRAVAPAGSGFGQSGTRARAAVADDSTQIPITYVYLHKLAR